MAFTRTRDARSRVPAAAQRQPSMVGSVPDLGSDTCPSCEALGWLPAVTSSAGANLQPRFSASISPAHISRPRREWVGAFGVSCGEALPEPASCQSSPPSPPHS